MSFDRQPTLIGEIVMLRPLRHADWDALSAVASDPQIWAMHPMQDRWQEPVFRAFFAEAMSSGGALAVIERASNRIVGSSRFDRFDAADGGSVEIGWSFLACECWGQGHNRDMKRLMLGHALAQVARVDFRVGETNKRSRRALEKIGARLAPDRIEEAVLPGGSSIKHVYYELTREEFETGPLSR